MNWLGMLAAMAAACGAQPRTDPRGPVVANTRAPIDALAARVERGRYLVSHVAACIECHSPRNTAGEFDRLRWLAGVDCFVDVAPDDPDIGCLSTPNLTDHETGLRNRSDGEIEDMMLRGVRPDGKALHPFMPYRFFANMRARDAEAIVAYLRTVPGVDHTSPPSQPPFLPPPQPVALVPDAAIPLPRADYPEREAALRGRYLAGSVGICMDCHTPRGPSGIQLERAFQGGMKLERAMLRLPSSYPDVFYTANLTPHATGIAAYSIEDIVRAVKHGEDPNQNRERLCPPMPAGPGEPFSGITDADAADIAHYLRSLSPAENAIPVDCRNAAGGAPTGEARAALPPLPAPGSNEPFWLSQTGLYADIARRELAPGLREFTPAHALWSDGAEKRRWLYLPEGTRIDNSDMDHFQFPVGTRLFKEFTRAGKRIETRVIVRTGPGPADYFMGAFVWSDDERDARFVPDGVAAARGTAHDVPSAKQCFTCHGGEPGRVLGFSAVQQPRLSNELLGIPSQARYEPPGDAVTAAALGYLHANCGHCHNPSGSARPDADLDLRLRAGDRTAAETAAYRTAVGRPLQNFRRAGQRLRVMPGDPAQSALFVRMAELSPEARMPPIASHAVDDRGLALVRAWIESLAPAPANGVR